MHSPAFNLISDGVPQHSPFNPESIQEHPPEFPPNTIVTIANSHDSHPNQQATVINIPICQQDPHVLLIPNSNQLLEIEPHHLSPLSATQTNPSSPTPPQIKLDGEVTLHLPDHVTKS